MASDTLYQILFYVPNTHIEIVKQAMFDAGAGRIGDYEHCAWQVLGEGQFKPLVGSQPFIGEQDSLSKVAEYRVEMVCDKAHLQQAVRALINAHPYQTPAYSVFENYRVD